MRHNNYCLCDFNDEREKVKMSEKKFNEIEYKNQYNKDNYDRLTLNLPRGFKAKMKKHMNKKGFANYSSYIVDLIKKDMA
mgnify:CR=1 FL=1